jgi:hypothetical protein
MIDKPENKSYRLISGSFSPDAARQVLLSLINHKINFHQLSNWSHRERFGEDNPAAVKRIEELSQTREDIAQLLDESVALGLNLRINSNIEIELSPEPST